MSISSATLRARLPTEERPRTPAIEDDQHPLNVWHSARSNNRTIDSYFPPQHQAIEEHFDHLRHIVETPKHDTRLRRASNVGPEVDHLSWRERVRHTTWAYFTMTMATGGIANALHSGRSGTKICQNVHSSHLFGSTSPNTYLR